MAPATAAEPKVIGTPWIRFVKGVNSFIELPFVYEGAFIVYWVNVNLLGPFWAACFLLGCLLEGLSGKWWPRYHKPQPGQAIVITGCDTGFGHESALRLARAGWVVYAGCLTEAGMAALVEKAGPAAGAKKLVPVQMDVTKPEDVERVVKRLVEDGVSLYALINNAGIGHGAPMDWMPISDYRKIMEVNYFAVIQVIQSCLPLLKASKGRILNISSVAGLAAAPTMSAYAASKHAVEALSTAIRLELAPFGIKVITLNPSFHATPIATNALSFFERSYKALSAEKRAEYGIDYYKAFEEVTGKFINGCWEPEHVINKIVKATTLVDPMPQYIVGMDGRFAMVPMVFNTPLNFQAVLSLNTLFRKCIPAAVRDPSLIKPPAAAVAVPTKTGKGKKKGNGNAGH